MYGMQQEKKVLLVTTCMCLVTTSVLWCHHIPYCPGQAPMGARSSSAKIWVWTFAQRRCSTIPPQGPTPDVKVIYQLALNRLASSLRPCFIEARPTMEKAVTCYKVDWLIASLPSFCCISVVACSTWILCCRGRTLRTKPQTGVCKPDVTTPKACQNNRSYVIYIYLRISMHGGRHWAVTPRTLKNHKAVKIGVWVLACPGQYGIQESIISYYWQVYSTCTQGERREHSWLLWCVPCERRDGCSPDSSWGLARFAIKDS